MEHHSIKFPKTAHYYTIGAVSPKVKYFWLVTHGYGQLASRIVQKFKDLGDEHFIVAPEGLSRFYWDMKKGEVGASWMTKLDRLDEIEDHTAYLKSIYEQFVPQLNSDVKIIMFGFSQGCATQIRWLLNTEKPFDDLVLWCGVFPDDVNYGLHHDYLKDKQIHFYYGDQDQFIDTPEKAGFNQTIADREGLRLKTTVFKGKHVIPTEVLKELVKEIQSSESGFPRLKDFHDSQAI